MNLSTMMTVQEAIDQFDTASIAADRAHGQEVERCLDAFAAYLLHFSDLFHDDEHLDEGAMEEWEESLGAYMEQLFEGDVEPSQDLGALTLSQLDPEHVHDFLAWFILRETEGDQETVEVCGRVMREWVEYLAGRGWIDTADKIGFLDSIRDAVEMGQRVAKAARLLLRFVRMGSGMPESVRTVPFSDFIEGHAQVHRIDQASVTLRFEEDGPLVGPIALPEEIIALLREGDVMDVEVGRRGEIWQMVDIGPVYPASVHVEPEVFGIGDIGESDT
ncbi:MAG TPA: hypothetical protein VNH42_05095 [Mariprofundaceae bacterium]|nr:hypothetical protein [Mariprofundaceae bacterium]